MRIDRVKFAAELARSDLKMYELAEISGVTRATITAVKGGKSCTRQTAEKLAAGLGVPLSTLLESTAQRGA